MKNIHDQFAKGILKAALAHVARLETNREIPGHVLAADLWVEPTPGAGAGLEALGALGRMVAGGPCLVEPFSGVPRVAEIRSCILKQYSLDHAQRRVAKAAGTTSPPFPRLWVTANGSPDGPIEQLELRPMGDGWPDGFMTGRRFDPLHLVVIRKLPKTPETLLLRLLGRGQTFREAARELAELPIDAHLLTDLVKAVRHVLIEFRQDFDQDQLEEDDMESIRDMAAAYDEWELRVRVDERRTNLVEAIEGFCEILGINLTSQQRQDMAGWDIERLESTAATLRSSRRWPT